MVQGQKLKGAWKSEQAMKVGGTLFQVFHRLADELSVLNNPS